MPRFWTAHWQNRFWRDDVNPEGVPISGSFGSSFRKRGVSKGDVVFVISLTGGQLYLGGRMLVADIVDYASDMRVFASTERIAAAEGATKLDLHRRLAPEVTRRLRFVAQDSEPKALFFTSDTDLDAQTTRGVRELTAESAALLNRIIDLTDGLPRSELLTVTEKLLDGNADVNPSPSDNTIENGNFDPNIDRYDSRSVARLFHWLWPDPAILRDCFDNLAISIETAHESGNAAWSLTMFGRFVRLNVGPVEVLTMDAHGARFLFQSPLEIATHATYEIGDHDRPILRSVPVPSGVCFVPITEISSLNKAVRAAHDAYIRSAAARKQNSAYKNSFSPAVLEYMDELLGKSLPRPAYFSVDDAASLLVNSLPEEAGVTTTLREGARYQVIVNAYERHPKARKLCIAKYGTACCVCGLSFGMMYGEAAMGLIHVHHLRPLSEIGEEYDVIPADDLRPVCPNCHAVLHRRDPPYSIEEVKQFIRLGLEGSS